MDGADDDAAGGGGVAAREREAEIEKAMRARVADFKKQAEPNGYYLLRQVGLHSLASQPSDTSFDDWWEKASTATSGLTQKVPNIAETLKLAGEERRQWTLARARTT